MKKQKSTHRKPSAKPAKQNFEMKIQSSKAASLILAAIIVLIGALLYYNTISYDLTHLDDQNFILVDSAFNSDLANIPAALTASFPYGYYRPLLKISFMLDSQIGGTNVSTYRATNLWLHIIASILVFFTLMKFDIPKIFSFLFALIFTIHPLFTSVVGWIPGRNESLLAVFLLPSLIFLVKYLKSKKAIFLFLHILFFIWGILTKETAIVFPFLCALYIIIYAKPKVFTREYIYLSTGWLLSWIIWLILSLSATATIKKFTETGFSIFLSSLPTIPAFLGKMFLPVNLCTAASFESFSIITGFIIIILLLASFLLKQIRKAKLLFAISWILLLILPSMFIRIVNIQNFFDYLEPRFYLPAIGVFIILFEALKALKIDFRKPVFFIVYGVMLIALIARTENYEKVFNNRVSFFSKGHDLYPNKSNYIYCLGKGFLDEKKLNEAEYYYLLGTKLYPKSRSFNLDLSYVYFYKNNYKKVEEYAKRELQLDSLDSYAWLNLGVAYVYMSRFSDAEYALLKAIHFDCENYIAFVNLIGFYLLQKENQKAVFYAHELKRFGGTIPPDIQQQFNEIGIQF